MTAKPRVRQPLSVLRAVQFRGYVAGLAQPCVALDIAVAPAAAQACLERIDRLFPGASRGPEMAETDPARRVPMRIARTAVGLLGKAGLPVFTQASVRPVGARPEGAVFRLLVPAHPGCLPETLQLLLELVRAGNAAASAHENQAARGRIHEVLRTLRAQAPRGKNTLPMLEAAHRLGIPWTRVRDNVYCLGQGSRGRWFDSTLTDRTPAIGVALAKNKAATAAVLRGCGLPVPPHELVSTETAAREAARRIGFPLVVKPVDQERGIGVVAGLKTIEAVLAAFHAAKAHSKEVLVEAHFTGHDHRLHVFDGEVYRVRHRIPGGVSGDGAASVRALLDALNADPRRGRPGSSAELIRIDLDAEALDLLAEQGLTAEDVPAAGRYVQLRRIANVSAGGVSVPVDMASVHPDNLELATRAVAALKLDLAAVDLLIPDIARSWTEVGAAICEVNAKPQFGGDAPEWLFGRMLPGQGRIPVVAVLCPPARDDGWMVAVREAVARTPIRLGVGDASGCWIGLRRVAMAPAATAFDGVRMLAGNDSVDALLLCADASFLQHGLPVDRVDAFVLLAAGQTAEQAALAQRIAARSTRVLADASAPAIDGFAGKALPGTAITRLDRTALSDAVLGLLCAR